MATVFPFAAIIAGEARKLAPLIGAVEPAIGRQQAARRQRTAMPARFPARQFADGAQLLCPRVP